MVNPTALVVEDDPLIVPVLEDSLVALHHEYDVAGSQADAEQLLAAKRYDYVLLDLAIPARATSGGASTDFGLLLLEHIRAAHAPSELPVMVMTVRTGECVDLTKRLVAAGANEFISKPFPASGRTLASVIRSVLERPAAPDKGSGDSTTTDESRWLTVTQGAHLLLNDVDGIVLENAKARVSRAASAGRFRTNAKHGAHRRIEPISFDAWRLKQRDINLDRLESNY
jgi:DNA-binding response OmpR family regulator